ncbi:aldo/keto reductase [Streptomyces sp. W16]|uniref:aldo/keto reductase n=1 Tax=Streptomyces sp. W16 TaxID=3076631 RepID=UPI00295BF662|nr:aldo/keto reductase [Streptomyces sp. W16]MDV9172028.1 aldo/keto reductase [Streptomyces sp. W16]
MRSLDQLDADDWRRSNPRFEGDNLEANIRIVEQVDDVAKQLGATPAQIALAWLLAQGDDIAPIPGTRRIANLEQNVVADELVLSAGQLERLSEVAVPIGDRYADMSRINR